MSKVVIQGNASGTGNFTIAAPNSNTDRTFNLPDEAGTIVTTAGVPVSAFPSGSVINVETSTITTNSTRASATGFADDLVFNSYTPVRTNSTVHIIGNAYFDGDNNTYCYSRWLVNGSTYGTTGGISTGISMAFYSSTSLNTHGGLPTPLQTSVSNTDGSDISVKCQAYVSSGTLYILRTSTQSAMPGAVTYIEVA